MKKKFLAVLCCMSLAVTMMACGKSIKDVVGTTTGTTYVNSYFGIEFTADSNWTLQSQSEIEDLNKQASSMMSEDYAKILESIDIITDMYAVNVNGTDTVNSNVEKIPAGTKVTEQSNLEAAQSQLIDALGSMGLENITSSISTVTFAGESHPILYVEGDIYGYKVYEGVISIKKGSYLYNVSVCSWLEDKVSDYLAMFTKK